MSRQNRVTPFGEIVAARWRGAFMGNRGILHDADGNLGIARWRHMAWVCCVTEFRDRWRPVMTPGNYTELFFRDEATALAAGHRPCAQCRWEDHQRFRAAWQAAGLRGKRVVEIDRTLHAARVTRDRQQIRHIARAEDLPDGAMFLVMIGAAFGAMVGAGSEARLRWAGSDYALRKGRYVRVTPVTGPVEVLTPKPTVDTLRAGYRPVSPI